MAKVKSKVIFGRLVQWAISSDNTGFDVGMFSCKKIAHPQNPKATALRLVAWRLAVWVQLTNS